jgi:hypothetical protein
MNTVQADIKQLKLESDTGNYIKIVVKRCGIGWKTTYYIANDWQQQVIIYISHDRAILMPLNHNLELERKYTIVPIEELGEMAYRIFSRPLTVRTQ